jgi:hypothetical protein
LFKKKKNYLKQFYETVFKNWKTKTQSALHHSDQNKYIGSKFSSSRNNSAVCSTKSPPPLISGSYCTPVPPTLTPYSTITKWIMCISSALNQEKNTCKEWFSSITSYSHCLHISHTKYCKYFSLKTLNINM